MMRDEERYGRARWCERGGPAWSDDARQVALAERVRVPLWTCERRLAKELGAGPAEVHLVL